MSKQYRNSAEFLAEHALSEDQESAGRIDPTVAPSERTDRKDEFRPRRKPSKRKLSVLNVTVTIAGFSAVVVLYVYNAIRVGELSSDIGDLQNEMSKLQHTNEVLRAEVNQKSTMERITTLAGSELQMIYPKQQLQWFVMDNALEQKARELQSGEKQK